MMNVCVFTQEIVTLCELNIEELKSDDTSVQQLGMTELPESVRYLNEVLILVEELLPQEFDHLSL